VTPENTRQAVNAGKSRYRGIEGAVGVALTSALRLDASYSISSQRYVHYVPQATVSYSGNRVEQAPRDLANVFLAYSPPLLKGGRLALEYNHTGRYAEDAANTHFYGGFDIVNLQGSFGLTPSTQLFARVTNLLDRNYAELVSFDAFQGAQYNPGSPRTVYAGARYTWTR
jgi:outer membrane receptor protein involved in Fe transport